MVFMGSDDDGGDSSEKGRFASAATCDVGVGEDGDRRGHGVRQRLVAAMRSGRFYASTGVTIINVAVDGDQITVETANAERLTGSIDHGEIIARATGSEITFRVPPRATYARVTASRGEGVHHIEGEQFAWTQVRAVLLCSMSAGMRTHLPCPPLRGWLMFVL
jgi:hypothetical protein